jgi:hypothetical protein
VRIIVAIHKKMAGESLSRSSDDREKKKSSLSLADKLWIALAVGIFVIAFAIILIYGVF